MLSFRSVRLLRGEHRVEFSAAPEAADVVESSLVPCNNLRAHWVTAADGKLELRWELDSPADRTHAA